MGRTLDVADAVKGRQVTVWGEYALSIDRIKFSNAGFKEGRLHTDHRMVLAVLRGERELRNRMYRQGMTLCPIKPQTVRPQSGGRRLL